jgi:hypothetical protein
MCKGLSNWWISFIAEHFLPPLHIQSAAMASNDGLSGSCGPFYFIITPPCHFRHSSQSQRASQEHSRHTTPLHPPLHVPLDCSFVDLRVQSWPAPVSQQSHVPLVLDLSAHPVQSVLGDRKQCGPVLRFRGIRLKIFHHNGSRDTL